MSKYNSLDTVETKDSTPTVISSYSTITNSSNCLDITLVARTDNFDTIVDRKIYVVKNINNVVSISDDVVNICNKQGHISISNVNIFLNISGTAVEIKVVGLENTSIVWVCNLDVIINSVPV